MRTNLLEISSAQHFATQTIDDLTLGPFSSVRWIEMVEIAALAADLFVSKCHLDRGMLTTSAAFRHDENAYLPAITIVTEENNVCQSDVELVVSNLARTIMSHERNQMPLFGDDLQFNHDLEEAPEVIQFLARKGDRKITQPMDFVVNGKTCASLAGKFSTRPIDKINATKRELRCIVEKMDAPAREAEVRCHGDRSSIKVRFSELCRLGLAMSIGNHRPIQLEVEEALDAQGRKFLNVCSLKDAPDIDFTLVP